MASVAIGVVLIDQLSKAWALGLEPCASLIDPPVVGVCLAYNDGMAFSMGQGGGPIIAVLVAAVVGVLVVSARRASPSSRLLMGLIAGGAIGNIADRAFRSPAPGSSSDGFMSGAVIDFLHTSFFATFNVADSAVVVGGLLLAVWLWRMPEEPAGATPDPSGSSPRSAS